MHDSVNKTPRENHEKARLYNPNAHSPSSCCRSCQLRDHKRCHTDRRGSRGSGLVHAQPSRTCVIESQQLLTDTAGTIQTICNELDMPFIFKSSFTKDNRSSVEYFQGPGLEKGLEMLDLVKKEFNIPILSDIHNQYQAVKAAEVLDVIQIPAYLSMQTSLGVEAGKTGKVINVKKGQFLHPKDMENVVKKIESTGNEKILLTERGSVFGYHNLVVDMRSIPMMQSTGYPVISTKSFCG